MTPEEIKALQKENAKLKEANATEQKLSQALQEELAKRQEPTAAEDELVPKLPGKAVKVGKNSYKFTIPQFNLNGELITAEQAAKDEKILKQLEEIGFGGWQQVS